MRRISPAFALAAVLLISSPALAAHHRMSPSEVLLSSGGDDAIQYIEIEDPAEESFPDNDYVLAIYDVDGNLIDSVSFDVVANTRRAVVGTAAADAEFDTNRIATLPVTLPMNGQACFELADGTKFGCTAWGCVNTVLTGSTTSPFNMSGRGATPPDGMSLQRFVALDNSVTYSVLEPTPGTANEMGTEEAACPTDPDAGPAGIDAGGGDIDGGTGGPDGGGGNGGGDGGGDDDDSGCGCRTSSPRGATSMLLVLAMYLGIARRRRLRDRGTRT